MWRNVAAHKKLSTQREHARRTTAKAYARKRLRQGPQTKREGPLGLVFLLINDSEAWELATAHPESNADSLWKDQSSSRPVLTGSVKFGEPREAASMSCIASKLLGAPTAMHARPHACTPRRGRWAYVPRSIAPEKSSTSAHSLSSVSCRSGQQSHISIALVRHYAPRGYSSSVAAEQYL